MKTLIRVLLLGEHWDRLEPAFASLSNKGVVEFVGPVVKEIPEAVSETSPSAIMVSPGSGGAGLPLLNISANGKPFSQPVLLCVEYQGLESQELYEYADDFLLIPCSAAELEKRLSRLVRSKRAGLPLHPLRFGKITLDTSIYEVRLAGKRVELAWMEFQLLKFLMENPGRIFTRDQLLSSVWSADSFGGTRTVDVHIQRLRLKLGIHGSLYIRTVANVGYGLVDP